MSSSAELKSPPHLSMARAKRLVSLGNAGAMLLALWTIVLPEPYYPLVGCCFILPVLAVGLDVWIGGALTWETSTRRKTYPFSFVTILVLPALAVCYRASGDFNFLNWQTPIAWSLLVAACICGAAYWLVPKVRTSWRQLLNVFLFALTFGYAAVAFADTLLDPFETRTSSATVADKNIHVSGGAHGSSVWYNVSVVPFRPGWTRMRVRPDIYRQLHIGQRACVVQGSGLFGMGWLEVRPCASA